MKNDPLLVLQGDVLDRLREIPDESVHCCVTSPPYWGLRDYGVVGQIGLEPTPEEYVSKMVKVFEEVRRVLRRDGVLFLNLGDSYFGVTRGSGGKTPKQLTNAGSFFDGTQTIQSHSDVLACGSDGTEQQDFQAADRVCPDCGGELTICSQIRRHHTSHTCQSHAPSSQQPSRIVHDTERAGCVVASDFALRIVAHQSTNDACTPSGPCASVLEGTASEHQSKSSTSPDDAQPCEHRPAYTSGIVQNDRPSIPHRQDMVCVCMACGYSTRMSLKVKPKDLCGIPWRLAFALQAAGWWLRSDIIWAKPNPMPESVQDRPTKAHEYVFLLAKSANYFYDAEAVKETSVSDHPSGNGYKRDARLTYQDEDGARGSDEQWNNLGGMRNRRTVWEIPTEPFPDSHFAVFPTALVKPCILAGTSARGCCPKCGAPWERVVDVDYVKNRPSAGSDRRSRNEDRQSEARGHGGWRGNNLLREAETTGWQPMCQHGEDPSEVSSPIPCTVLDPFAGSGTTGQVALELGRKAILIELNPDYVKLIHARCSTTIGMPLGA